MKRNLILAIIVMVAFMAATLPLPVQATSAEDYKVIKKAVKDKKSADKIAWFRLEVTEKKSKKSKVKIKIPIALVDMLADCEKDIDIDGKCKVNLKKIIQELKKNGPMTLIEVDDEDELVKIWFE